MKELTAKQTLQLYNIARNTQQGMGLDELAFITLMLGVFSSEAEAVRRARYLPRGRYTLREWARDGEFSTFDPAVNRCYTFDN